MNETTCIICSNNAFSILFNGKIINNYNLMQCNNCSMVMAFPVYKTEKYEDFSNYGNYLILDDKTIKKRIKRISKQMQPLFKRIKGSYQNAQVLDFGCGAGYFCKAAQDAGINAYGIEVSEKLRSFSKTKLKVKNIFDDIDNLNHNFDIIFIFDVIEHLNPLLSKTIMKKVISRINSNGLLIGQTPNFMSANILLCKDRDPVISPPSHSCYFTLKTIDMYLTSMGLQKIKLYSRGFSSNSFFRKEKFKKSFLEKGIQNNNIYSIPLYIFIKVIFNLLDFLMQPVKLGYQIHFIYKNKNNSE